MRQYIGIIERKAKTLGKREALNWGKACRLCFTRYIAGEPLESYKTVELVDGLPKELYFLHQYAKTPSTQRLRFLLTCLNAGRAVTLDPAPDISTITDPCRSSADQMTGLSIDRIRRRRGIRKFTWEFRRFHASTKVGPNGQALLCSPQDAAFLTDRQKMAIRKFSPKLFMHIQLLTSTIGDRSFADIFHETVSRKPVKGLNRKLSHFGDLEGKTRTIGILDYWSQTALKPLHDKLMFILKGIKEDCTFDQGS